MVMETRIASPELVNDNIAQELIARLESLSEKEGVQSPIFYYRYPIFRDESDRVYRSKALLVTKSHGIFVFGILTGSRAADQVEVDRIDSELTQLDTILYGKFLRSKRLRRNRRQLDFPVSIGIFTPEKIEVKKELDSPILYSDDQLSEFLREGSDAVLSDEQWDELLSLLEGGKAIAHQESRDLSKAEKGSCAEILGELEKKITNFDRQQRHAALSMVKGPQRIRGIAGSGKTIILAKKAANLHLEYPDQLILVAFWTKSLYDLLKQQITRFYRQFSDRDPDWSKIHVLHAWGGRNNPGVYYNASIDNGRRPLTFRDVVAKQGESKFEFVCRDLLRFAPLQQKYDYVLIDEGQDLPKYFYQLCFEISQGGEIDRNIVWVYDELQTIMDARVQDVRDTFGTTGAGESRVDLERAGDRLSKGRVPHDLVLKKSYRNPGEILVSAHAVGFGVNGPEFVQILENAEHWDDLGYEVAEGNCEPGEKTVIRRPEENSPLNLNEFQEKGSIIKCFEAEEDGFTDEVDFVCNEIEAFIESGLNPHDILIISIDDLNTRTYFKNIAERLNAYGIGFNNLQDSVYSIPKFALEGMVTGSTVYKAKGNEAPVVFVVGVDALADRLEDVRARNRLFTAMTRSRAWLRVSGLGRGAGAIIGEIEKARDDYPYMSFQYPDPDRVRTLQRDLSLRSKKLHELREKMIELGLDDLESEEIDALRRTSRKKKE